MLRCHVSFLFLSVLLVALTSAWTPAILSPRSVTRPPSSSSTCLKAVVAAEDSSRRDAFFSLAAAAAATAAGMAACVAIPTVAYAAGPVIDVNNALAREYTAFPGMFPTIATKIVKGAKEAPYKSKKDVYALLNDMERERLLQYDKAIVINKPDKALQQFKNSQICKYECGGRVSNPYRDEQIKAIQTDRR